jgi:hypothetical protein
VRDEIRGWPEGNHVISPSQPSGDRAGMPGQAPQQTDLSAIIPLVHGEQSQPLTQRLAALVDGRQILLRNRRQGRYLLPCDEHSSDQGRLQVTPPGPPRLEKQPGVPLGKLAERNLP